MIELKRDRLKFSFPEVHPLACLAISFQRTLRIPDDDRTYPLPPGLGNFPVRHVDDYSRRVPEQWLEHGGVMLPMYQSEALWLSFTSVNRNLQQFSYPFAVRVLTGKIDAVTGEPYEPGLRKNDRNRLGGGAQNYVVSPYQPWLDGYCVKKGVVRQFVAMPLGQGYSAEEQITGESEHGGIQVIVYPMKGEAYEKRLAEQEEVFESYRLKSCRSAEFEMGIAPGGKIKQEIYADEFDISEWRDDVSSRCFIHIANSLTWRQITRSAPPTKPPTANSYAKAGLPWFEYYNDNLKALDATESLERLLSVNTLKKLWHGNGVSNNQSCDPKTIITTHKKKTRDEVREGTF